MLAATPWWYWLGWSALGLTLLVLVVLAVEAHRKVAHLRKQVESMQAQLDEVETSSV